MKRYRRSDRIESALLAGFSCGALSGAGVLVWWLPLCLFPVFAGLFRKYALYTAAASVLAGFFLAHYCSQSYDRKVSSISEQKYSGGRFLVYLNDTRLCRISGVRQPSMLNAKLVHYKLNGTYKTVECSYNVMVRLPEDMAVPEYGSMISGYGNISDSADPGFSNYLKSRNIVKCIYLRNAEVSGRRQSLMGYILRMRDKIASRVLRYVENDNSKNLAAALFFGITGGFTSDLRSSYVNTGTVHIFSVSGMHVAVLSCFLFYIFRIFGMRYGYLLTLLFAGFYVVSTGASAPALRAYFMLSIWGITRICFLWLPPFSVFCWASFFLLLLEPLLVLDVGARYSIVITGILVAVTGLCSEYHKRREEMRRKYLLSGGKRERMPFWEVNWHRLKLSLYICIAAFAGGLAVSLHHNGQLLLFSIPINLLLAPFMSLFYLLLGIAMLIPQAGVLMSWAFVFLHWFCSFIAEYSTNIPAASPGSAELWLYTAVLFAAVRCKGIVRVSAVLLMTALIVRWMILPYVYPRELWLYNHDGRPCSIMLLESSSNSAVVIDPASGAAASEIVRHLHRRGVTRVECVMFSRNSVNAARGMRTLCRKIPVENAVLPEIKRYEKWKMFRRYLDGCGVGKEIKVIEKHKNVKIIRQKGVVTLEYFKRCAKLKDVLILKEEPGGRQLEIKSYGFEKVLDQLPYNGSKRIYRYEFEK